MKCPVQKKHAFRRSAQHMSNMLPGVDPASWAAPRAWPSAGSWPAGSWPAGRSSAGRLAAGRSSALDKSSWVKHCQDNGLVWVSSKTTSLGRSAWAAVPARSSSVPPSAGRSWLQKGRPTDRLGVPQDLDPASSVCDIRHFILLSKTH